MVEGHTPPPPTAGGPKKILKASTLVACPTCGAAAGRQCITSGGKRTVTAHVWRKQAAAHQERILMRSAQVRVEWAETLRLLAE